MYDIIYVILFLFCIKHFICDFPLQNARHYTRKGVYGAWGGVEHALVHSIGTLIVFYIVYISYGIKIPIIFMWIDFVFHYHIDWAKSKINTTYSLTSKDKWFWILLGFDQLLHSLTYLGITYYGLV